MTGVDHAFLAGLAVGAILGGLVAAAIVLSATVARPTGSSKPDWNEQ